MACISFPFGIICRLSPGLRVVQSRSNTIKHQIFTCTALVINTKVSFVIVDQWQRIKGKRGTSTAKTMNYLPRNFCSSAPEGMLFWKSIFLPRVSSPNIMRWPLNKAPKPKHSGKHSHTKVTSLTGLNHCLTVSKKTKKEEEEEPERHECLPLKGGLLGDGKPKVRCSSWREQMAAGLELNNISNEFHSNLVKTLKRLDLNWMQDWCWFCLILCVCQTFTV